MSSKKVYSGLKNFLSYGLFWSWNIIFVLTTVFLLIPFVYLLILKGLYLGSVSVEVGMYAGVIFLLPFVSVALGLTKHLKKQRAKLFLFFYGIEIPLFFLMLTRLFVFNTLNAGIWQLYILFFIGVFGFSILLFKPNVKAMLMQPLVTCAALLGNYMGLLLSFFSIPILWMSISTFFQFEWIEHVQLESFLFLLSPVVLLSFIFMCYLATLILGLPFALFYLYNKTFITQFKRAMSESKRKAILLVSMTIMLNAALFYQLNTQNQQAVFSMLSTVENQQQQQSQIAQQEWIKTGLMNAYLSEYRYFDDNSNTAPKDLYEWAFDIQNKELLNDIQQLFHSIARPFIYDGKYMRDDHNKAIDLYAQFFDEPIEKGQRALINSHLKNDWNRLGAEAGLIDADKEKVLLREQSIDIDEREHDATITISEVYENKTSRNTEIFYYFILPEEAVVSGLWLSDDANDLEKYPAIVAPRGAAQQVYKEEVSKRRDPAFLEQLGPKQYRLRVFPILAKERKSDVAGSPLWVKFKFQQLLSDDGYWKLPTLGEKRNVYWNKTTQYRLNGQADDRDYDTWLPEKIKANMSTPFRKSSQHLAIGQQTFKVDITPYSQEAVLFDSKDTPHWAVLIDTSYSMRNERFKLNEQLENLEKLQQQGLLTYVIYEGKSVGESVIKSNRNDDKTTPFTFYGHINQQALLHNLKKKIQGTNFTDVMLLTDQGSYEMEGDHSLDLSFNKSLWFVHLGKAPYAYQDDVYQAIVKSSGGIVYSIDQLMRQKTQSNWNTLLTENLSWRFTPTDLEANLETPINYQAMIAKQFINKGYRDFKRSKLSQLDALHEVAVINRIVSPLSSMLALVTEEQKQALKEASKADDRFDREVEDGNKLSFPSNALGISAVPEPETWALLLIVLAMLTFHRIKKQKI